MINNNPENNSSGEFNSEANGPINEANSSQTNSTRKYAESFDEDKGIEANAINGEEGLSSFNEDQVNASGTSDEADFSLPEDSTDFTGVSAGSGGGSDYSTASNFGADEKPAEQSFTNGSGKASSTVNKIKDKINQFGGNEKLGKVKDVGRKGLAPIVDVLHRHRGDINPYIDAIGRALKAGVDSLNQDNANDADRTVSGWFSEASQWFDDLKTRFDSTNGSDLISYIEEEGQRRPGFMFAISYVAGLGFGRMGRHLGQRKVNDIQNPTATMH